MLCRSGKSKTMDQFMVQIQELQDKVNSPSDAREFYDPETVRSSGFLHVPSPACEYSESKRFDQPRFLLAACYTELMWYIRKRF